MTHIKLVTVGDKDVDSKELLASYYFDSISEYIPSYFETKRINFDSEDFFLELMSTKGYEKEENKRDRELLMYNQADIFLLVFSLVNPTSLMNIENIWLPEIKEKCPDVPYILVGTKINIRDNFMSNEKEYRSKGFKPVTKESIEEMMEKIQAKSYIECDAYDKKSTQKVIDTAFRVLLNKGIPSDEKKDLLRINFYGDKIECKTTIPLKYILGKTKNNLIPENEDGFIKIVEVNNRFRKLTINIDSTNYDFTKIQSMNFQLTDVNGIIFIFDVAEKRSFEFLKKLIPSINKSNKNKIPAAIVAYNNEIEYKRKKIQDLIPIAEIENLSDKFNCPLFMIVNESDDDIEDVFFYIIKRIAYKIKNQRKPIKKVKKTKKSINKKIKRKLFTLSKK